VSGDQPKPSLADEAAAWVPPWAREPAPPTGPGTNGSTVDGTIRPGEPSSTVDGAVWTGEPSSADDEGPDAEAEPSTVDDIGTLEPPAVVAPSTVDEPAEPPAAGGAADDLSPVDDGPPAADPPEVLVLDVDASDTEDTAGRTPEEAPTLDQRGVRGALEAILLVVDEPVAEVTLAQTLEQPVDVVTATLRDLAEEYAETGRGFELRRAAGGWRLYTRPDFAPYVERFVLDGQQVRLTQAALETLAVVAYKQPVTRSRISAIRGVNCDGVIRTLVSRGLIEECGTEPESGAFLYRTTSLFLEKLGMDSVGELPPLAPFLPDDVDEIADAPPR
jgi:segregation and condensation protein B